LGNGVAENGEEAERWLKRAEEAGYNEAASVLGTAYATGKAGSKGISRWRERC
jgi:TPR repeat protein